ncbi:DUF726 domain-containing protein [Natranaeroarchaeum aerophilus]|uniref:TMCO4 family protein n=1 Tax=Natranaeroarchaeum aerophilus TaxID=2917711 RepID=A0AAE3FSW3_9EURY|nr:DUF726 domain-containing protein [Natranaeroarchaeum aerophilus]MCL9814445.1 TMCO4 family protein [Natranaeroarchaeum aerophilus]
MFAAGGTLGVAGGGAFYVYESLQGDFGDHAAPLSPPVLSTRGTATDTGDAGPVRTEGAWAIDDSSELFLFVHGFDTEDDAARDQAYATQVGLDDLRPAPVAAYSWDSAVNWDAAKRNADANAAPLADWLIDWDRTDGRPIHLVGYSLGARVVCETLRVLEDHGETGVPASVSLLGGAIPYDSVERPGRYGSAIAAVDAQVTNFHSRNDRVLGWVYRVSDRTRAVGHGGINTPDAAPAGYRDVAVTELVDDHYSYFQPGEGCLPQLVEQIE